MEIPKPAMVNAMHVRGKGPAGITIAYAISWQSEPVDKLSAIGGNWEGFNALPKIMH